MNPAFKSKYNVTRQDGTTPEWPHFVLGARDPAAPAALLAYAAEAERLGMDKEYIQMVSDKAMSFLLYQTQHGKGDPKKMDFEV